MKVGILSMQRVINYGSFLQAYSLKKNIEALGHQVEFVDYEVGAPLIRSVEEKKINRYRNKIEIVWDQITAPKRVSNAVLNDNLNRMYQLGGRYYKEFFEELGLTKEKNYTPELDALVIGSDEVFNCLQANPEVGYSLQLFGADARANKLISYAASFGNTTIDGIRKYQKEAEIKSCLARFDAISVRDENSGTIIKELTGQGPEYHLDPVFLYDYEPMMPGKKKESDYIVVYSYACRMNKKEAGMIKEFARKKNKKIICLSGPQFYFHEYQAYAPFEMLEFIKNADYVITDTFHGTVFSIKYNRDFAVFTRGGHEKNYGNSEKILDLLKRFELSDRRVTEERSLERILENEPDYTKVNKKIMRERNKSRDYLLKVLN